MAISMSAFFAINLPLLLVAVNAGAINQQTRQSNILRQQRAVGRQPIDGREQEAMTREDIIEKNEQQVASQVDEIPPASQPALAVPQQMQLSQLQQMQQLQQLQQMQQMQQMGGQQAAAQTLQAQQLLQAQSLQMQQMQKQLLQQQQELQRLQQLEKQRDQQAKRVQPQQKRQPKRRPARKTIHRLAQTPKKSLVGVNAQVMTKQDRAKAEMQTGSGSAGIAKPKGWDQCLKFARYVKSQSVTGTDLVKVWKSTCEPAVNSGRATQRYKLMCNSLSGVVAPYAAQMDYDVEMLCDSVLAVFNDVTAAR